MIGGASSPPRAPWPVAPYDEPEQEEERDYEPETGMTVLVPPGHGADCHDGPRWADAHRDPNQRAADADREKTSEPLRRHHVEGHGSSGPPPGESHRAAKKPPG